MKPLNIGISIRLFTPDSGGLQHHTAALIQHLQEQGHNIRIVTRAVSRVPSYEDCFYFSEANSTLKNIDTNIKVLTHSRLLNPMMWFVLKCVGRTKLRACGIRLYNAVYTRKVQAFFKGVDIVHHIGQGVEMIGFASAAAAERLNVPFLAQPTVHPGQVGDSEHDFELYNIADKLLVHTNYEKGFFIEKGFSKAIDVVGAGIDGRNDGDAEHFRNQYNIKGPLILFVGRKDADKGSPLVLEAFSKLRSKIEDVSLVCMGPGHHSDERTDNVIQLGFVDEKTKHDALAACDVLCVPSAGESFGLIFMEAARYRKAILARRLPVLQELFGIENAAVLLGREGVVENLVEVSAEELAEEMFRLLTNPELQNQIGENAFKVSQQFIWPAVITRFENAYEEVLRNHPKIR